MFCYILEEAGVDELLYSRCTFNTSILFLGFRHRSCSSVKAIMPLSATLPLAIGLGYSWFLIALLLYGKVDYLPKDPCLPNQF